MKDILFNKVMILDDDLLFGTLLKHFFKNQGYDQVEFHQNENSFLNSITSNISTLFILDYHLENLTGLELITSIKDKSDHSRILFISSETKSSVVNKTIQRGAIDFILKNKSTFKKLDLILKDH